MLPQPSKVSLPSESLGRPTPRRLAVHGTPSRAAGHWKLLSQPRKMKRCMFPRTPHTYCCEIVWKTSARRDWIVTISISTTAEQGQPMHRDWFVNGARPRQATLFGSCDLPVWKGKRGVCLQDDASKRSIHPHLSTDTNTGMIECQPPSLQALPSPCDGHHAHGDMECSPPSGPPRGYDAGRGVPARS